MLEESLTMAETLPAIPISFSPNLSEEPRVRRVKFGDGYEARLTDGLNPVSLETTLSWNSRTQADRDTLLAFFRRHGARVWWYWTPVGETRRRKFVAKSWNWSRSRDSSRLSPRFDVSAEVYEVHDLGI